MNIIYKLWFLSALPLSLISCVTTNNLYVNNPVPLGKGKGEAYVGLSTGVAAKIDYVSPENGKIHFSNKIKSAPVLSAGLQVGILNQTDIRLALHFASVGGSFGFRTGVQHSFFDFQSKMNIALGTDLGFVVALDSMKILGTMTAIDKSANGAINADVFIPVSIRLKDNFSLVVTPRYSLNTIYVRKFEDENSSVPFKFKYPAVSLGIRTGKLYFEVTTLIYHHTVYPHFGLAWMFATRDVKINAGDFSLRQFS